MGHLSNVIVVTVVAMTSCRPTTSSRRPTPGSLMPNSRTTITSRPEGGGGAFAFPGNNNNAISRKRSLRDSSGQRRPCFPPCSSVPSPGTRTSSSSSAIRLRATAAINPVAASTSLAHRFVAHGVTTFLSNWKGYTLIPLVAGFVGWLTNYLAVQMIFYPIRWRGIPFYKVEGEPLGLLGWQGIIPAKTLKMSEAMVNTTINELLTMEEIIQRLDPDEVADVLLPYSGQMVQPYVDELLADKPQALVEFATNYATDTDRFVQQQVARKFLRDLTCDVQKNIGSICNLRNCVVNMMMSDRSLLGKLFQISGKDELLFLVDSGLLFGFILGILQLFVSLYWDNPWTLSVGGLIVGLATNWLALKWIFEPVEPLKIGPIVLQGLFLRRQNEVSADFSEFFANRVLTSRQLWKSMLTDPTTLPEWEKLLAKRFSTFAKDATFGAVDLEAQKPRKLKAASHRLCASLFDYLEDLHEYVDEALEIEQTLRARMMAMTSAQFERVLHPIFEEDEMTLILSGGGLGFLAGFVQQLFATGRIKLPRVSLGGNANLLSMAGSVAGMFAVSVAIKPRTSVLLFVSRLIERTRRLKKRTYRYWRGTGRKKSQKSRL